MRLKWLNQLNHTFKLISYYILKLEKTKMKENIQT